jgi:protein-S-isoprenylcysteine O-methyltransferase Ste14
MPLGSATGKVLGLATVCLGMALFAWASFGLRGAISGIVAPRTTCLVTSGPYRIVRHPVYLGTLVALVGAAIAARSWVGFLVVVGLFLPTAVYRAKLEDAALSQEFGTEWREYAKSVGFFSPSIRQLIVPGRRA